jgi:ferritin
MEKPEYLGTLNAISLAESEAGVYLEAWANATDDEDLAACLRLVAARETSHGETFCRRIAELGYELQPKSDPAAAGRLAKYANPKVTDLEKIGPERTDTNAVTDFFADAEKKIADGYYDEMTCNMMQWYINEERSSGKILSEAYAKVRARNGGAKAKMNGKMETAMAGPSADAEAIMACMTAGFKSLEKSLEKLAKAAR